MDDFGTAFIVICGLGLGVVSIVAVFIARGAAKNASLARQEIARLQQHVGWLDNWLRHLTSQLQRESEERARLAAAPKIETAPAIATTAEISSETTSPAAEPIAENGSAVATVVEKIPEQAAAATAMAPPAANAPPASTEPAPTLEEQLGIVWLTRIGAAVFVVGALFFFKYAVDNAWIGPMGRVAIGALLGLVLLVGAELARPNTKASFVAALTGIGLAVLFASVWASSAFYGLVSPTIAFVANTAVLFLGAALSVRHRAEPTLAVSLAAGFLNPIKIMFSGPPAA